MAEGVENGWLAIILSGSGLTEKNNEIRVIPGLQQSRSPVSASNGVRVVIHPKNTTPFPFTEGCDVPPGYSASLAIRARRNIRIGPPHGLCTDINPFYPESDKKYRVIECQKTCVQSWILQECKCLDSGFPTLPNVSAKFCREDDPFPSHCTTQASPQCLDIILRAYKRIKCARRVQTMILTNSTKIFSACGCHPACNETTYDVSYSLSKWPTPGYESDSTFIEIFLLENFTVPSQKFVNFKDRIMYEERQKIMKEFLRLNVYVADSNVMKTEESPDYSINQLVSDIGGQAGLWIGMSVITLGEVLSVLFSLLKHAGRIKYSTNV